MSNIAICVNDTKIPSAIKSRKPGSVWIRPSSGKIYSVNEYGQLYVTALGSYLITIQGEKPWLNEILNGLRESFDYQGIPASSMSALFQKCKENAIGILNWNSPDPQAYTVAGGVNVLHFMSDFFKAAALYYDPALTEIATPLNPQRDFFAGSAFEAEQPQLFVYGGAFFGKYRAKIALIMLALADAIQLDADLGNYPTNFVTTGNMPEDRSALASFTGSIFDYISSAIS
jgi:hypothetical protein